MSKLKTVTHYINIKFIYKSHVEFEFVICYVIMI